MGHWAGTWGWLRVKLTLVVGRRVSTMDGLGSSSVWQCPGVEGRDGSAGSKGKEDVSPFLFNGKQIAVGTHRWM